MRAALSRKISTGLLIALAISPWLYVGSYFALVDARPGFATGIGPWQIRPTYRIGGDVAKFVFAPIHEFDRQVRPNYWQFN
jgi:hypothetical protein